LGKVNYIEESLTVFLFLAITAVSEASAEPITNMFHLSKNVIMK